MAPTATACGSSICTSARNFNPEVGYVRRVDFDRRFASARFSPRPKSGIVRKYTWEASLEYFENGAGALESRNQSGRFNDGAREQ